MVFWAVIKKRQKQPPRRIPRKRCSENVQQICRRTPLPKLPSNFIEITLRYGCPPKSCCIFPEYFHTPSATLPLKSTVNVEFLMLMKNTLYIVLATIIAVNLFPKNDIIRFSSHQTKFQIPPWQTSSIYPNKWKSMSKGLLFKDWSSLHSPRKQ